MKKVIIPLSLVVAVLASCSIEEESQPIVTSGSHLVFSGETTTATKVSIGEKDGGVYPLLWTAGDQIGIYSTDGTWEAETAELNASTAGSASGLFQTDNDLVAEHDMELVIVYPSTSTYSEGKVSGAVPSSQTQGSPDSSDHIGTYCVSYAEASIEGGQSENVEFTLSQKTAFVKMTVAPIEGYSDYYLSGITMTAEGEALSGDITCDVSDGSAVYSNTFESIGVTVSKSAALSESQVVYFTALPCDLTGKEVAISIILKGSGSESVTIPATVKGGKLSESCLSVIEVGSSSVVAWYDPVETRDLMDNWAYGKQNTFLIEQPASGSGHVNIDVRARGDFSKVKEPVYYGILTPADVSGRKLIYLPGDVADHEDVPTNKVNDDYTIDVYCYNQTEGTGHWGTVAIYDEDYNIIWSFMIWKYLTGDEPTGVKYSDTITVLDRYVGAAYSNKMAKLLGTFDPPASAYFEHGRKDPFLWENFGIYEDKERPDENTLANCIATPYIYYYKNLENWTTTNPGANYWGGVATLGAESKGSSMWETDDVGYKTVYDPCPAGWRVMDTKVANYLNGHNERWELGNNDKEYDNSDSPFYSSGEAVLAVETADGSYDYWAYSGMKNRDGTYGSTTSDNKSRGFTVWTNARRTDNRTDEGSVSFCVVYFTDASTGTTKSAVYGQSSIVTVECEVRCIKDDENR